MKKRCLGIPLIRFDENWQKLSIKMIINHLYCIMVFILNTYVLYTKQPIIFTFLDENYYNNAFLNCFYMIYDQIYSLSYCIITIYFYIYGSHLYTLLCNDFYNDVYQNYNQQSKLILIILFSFINYCFIKFHQQLLQMDRIIDDIWFNIQLIFVYYILFIYQFLPLIIYIYIKYATKFQLDKHFQLFQSSSSSSSKASSFDLNYGEKLIHTIQSLAKSNYQLDQLYSSHFFIVFISTIIDLIVCISNFNRNQDNLFDNIFYYSIIIIHLLYLMNLNENIQMIINDIEKFINQNHNHQRCRKMINSFDHNKRKICLRLIELKIFLEYFQMTILNIFHLNFHLLLNIICFIMTFCLLVVQTTNL